MIARSVLRCSATRRTLIDCRLRLARAKQCRYSTASSTNSANGASPASMLAAFTNELDRIAPRFDIQGSQIQILQTPADFYSTLKVNIVP
jgi:CDP-diacylglycerol---glycerol-3-phosphate 3-phosphatidyltransferase